MNKEKIRDQLIKILLKKANGFYYSDEEYEFKKTQNNFDKDENLYKNISFFDNFDTDKNIKSDCCYKMESSNGKNKEKDSCLTLVKKKVTKNYIPPDMLAIKTLFEICGEKVNDDDISNLTNEELLSLKSNLLKELENENSTN